MSVIRDYEYPFALRVRWSVVANDEQQRILKIEVRMKDQLDAEVNHLNKEVTRQKELVSNLQKEEDRFVRESEKFRFPFCHCIYVLRYILG